VNQGSNTIGGTVSERKSVAPPTTHKGWLLRRLVPPARWGHDPTVYDPVHVEQVARWLGWLFGERRYFRLDARGFHHVPAGTPSLLVSNHSGGTMVIDAWGLFMAWLRRFGTRRPLHALSHELVLSTEATGSFFARLGVLQAHPDVAVRALRAHRRDLLVMPGGDLDAWRPFKERYRVRFSGHTGYARTALRAGVPVVPVAHAGAHHSLLVITDGQRIAKALRVPLLARAHIWPLHLALPWGLAFGPLPHLPLPVTLRYRVGEPIEVKRRAPGERWEPSDEDVRKLDEKVRAEIQKLLDQLAEGG